MLLLELIFCLFLQFPLFLLTHTQLKRFWLCLPVLHVALMYLEQLLL